MQTKVPTFETVYRKAKGSLDAKNPENHVQIFVRFANLLTGETNINVWHVEQNMYKPEHQGGVSIKHLCETFYWGFINTSEQPEKP